MGLSGLFTPNVEALKQAKRTDKLVRLLSHENLRIGIEAATALGELGDPSVVEPLRRCMLESVPDVSYAAMEALLRIDFLQTADYLIRTVDGQQNSQIRCKTAASLLKNGKGDRLATLLLQLWPSIQQPDVRLMMAELLAECSSPEVDAHMLSLLRTDDAGFGRIAALYLSRRSIKPDWPERWQYLLMLGEWGEILAQGPEGMERLIEFWVHSEKDCAGITDAFLNMRDQIVLPLFRHTWEMKGNHGREKWETCLKLLQKMGKKAVSVLAAELSGANPRRWQRAVEALKTVNWRPEERNEAAAIYYLVVGEAARCAGLGEIAITPLQNALNYVRGAHNLPIHVTALAALKSIGTPRAVELVNQMKKEEPPEARATSGRVEPKPAYSPGPVDQLLEETLRFDLFLERVDVAASGFDAALKELLDQMDKRFSGFGFSVRVRGVDSHEAAAALAECEKLLADRVSAMLRKPQQAHFYPALIIRTLRLKDAIPALREVVRSSDDFWELRNVAQALKELAFLPSIMEEKIGYAIGIDRDALRHCDPGKTIARLVSILRQHPRNEYIIEAFGMTKDVRIIPILLPIASRFEESSQWAAAISALAELGEKAFDLMVDLYRKAPHPRTETYYKQYSMDWDTIEHNTTQRPTVYQALEKIAHSGRLSPQQRQIWYDLKP
ncbi:MAG TPA: HEAT repeat domain-containing protein [Symbiobacteriaceae bacterium]|nr:HEAT repeat domain-containing protein [Symbiobacteriaceae bacterium]